MYILHIETSTKVCSVALSNGLEVLDHEELQEGLNHTALLAPMIEGVLTNCRVKTTDLKGIAVSSGPGSFTGLRVGSSTAKAMAYSLGIPILPVPTLYALAVAAFEKYPSATLAMPMIDARRNEVYTGVYEADGKEIMSVSSLILEESTFMGLLPISTTVIVCGDGAKKFPAHLNPGNIVVDSAVQSSALHLIGPANRMMEEREFGDAMHFVPFYLKPPNITQPKAKSLS